MVYDCNVQVPPEIVSSDSAQLLTRNDTTQPPYLGGSSSLGNKGHDSSARGIGIGGFDGIFFSLLSRGEGKHFLLCQERT
jgi:hypothetical protein